MKSNKLIDKTKLREGDLIFISIPNTLYRAIEKSTNSKTSHIGILIKNNNQWMVAESRVPTSTLTPLSDFINRSDNSWFEIRRYNKSLSKTQIENLKKSCDTRYGIPYDFSFNLKSKKMFCSRFVYEVFKESCNVKVGEVESFNSLIEKDPSALSLFWRIWFLGFIPYKRLTITPQSQITDNNFKEVITNV